MRGVAPDPGATRGQMRHMTKTWFITGANRGFGYEIARAALAMGDTVVATARDPQQAREALALVSPADRLLTVALDVTDRAQVTAAVAAALDRFDGIDVLVNNAGYGQLGLFEQLTTEQIQQQFDTNVFGVFDVTRALLPHMRVRRSGHIITISSIAGITGIAGSTIYGATKFAITGWSEGLVGEVAQFGIKVTVVHPGMFRTDFLDPSSVRHGDLAIEDYEQVSADRREWLNSMNHAQIGDPTKFGPAVVELANMPEPPARWGAGSDAVDAFRTRAEQLLSNVDEFEQFTRSTDVA